MPTNDLPPVHPNCRCVIGPDEVWTDAGDARVCIYCLTRGAAWNLALPEPPEDQDIEDILDKNGRDEFRKAIERDSKVADAVIRDTAAKATDGIIIQTQGVAGEPLTVAIERLATRRLAELRARAPVRPGQLLPRLGEAAEEVWFEPAPLGRKKPVTAKIASIPIAVTPSYHVVRRNGRYYVQTARGRVLASDDNLALALLILLALMEKERRDAEERKRKAEADNQPA